MITRGLNDSTIVTRGLGGFGLILSFLARIYDIVFAFRKRSVRFE